MMTPMFRIIIIIISLGTLCLMMHKIRQAKVQIEASIFWVIFAMILVVFSIVPASADFMAGLLGIYSTPNFLFLFVIFLLMVKLFYMTIHISQLETRLKDLVAQMALEKKAQEEIKAANDKNHSYDAAEKSGEDNQICQEKN